MKKTVREDLVAGFKDHPVPKEAQEARIASVVSLRGLLDLLDRHPYDLSGGEQQRAALAKGLLLEPEILLMDEPTKGLDAEFKQVLAEIIQKLLHRGAAMIMVSHDIEFCARYAHRCALLFDGTIVSEGTSHAFFSGNSFYTTSANRIGRMLIPQAVTPEDLMSVCGGKLPAPAEPSENPLVLPLPDEGASNRKISPLLWRRKLIAALSGGGALTVFSYVLIPQTLPIWFPSPD